MASVNWLRSRQEQQEIVFWLSWAYDTKDKSLSNRLYLLYLIIFFSIWWFIVLVFFAERGASIFKLLAPENPIKAALALEIFIILSWWIIASLKAIWRSPVVFSEEDAYLICQMPLKPRNIVLRWLLMPWIKNLLPIVLISITIGFSLAESIFMPMEFSLEMFVNYLLYGFRFLLVITPIHLALFILTWAIGIWCLNNDRRIPFVISSLIISILISLILAAVMLSSFNVTVFLPIQTFINGILNIFLDGLGGNEFIRAGLSGWIFALMSFVILGKVSTNFSPSRSAQETQFDAAVKSLMRYGFVSQAKEMKEKRRLRSRVKKFWQPSWESGGAMLWKDILQSLRINRLQKIFRLFSIFSLMLSFVFIQDFKARLPILAIWTIQVGKLTSERVRNDLSRWTIIQQLPLSHKNWFFYNILFSCSLVLLSSLGGMILGSIFIRSLPLTEIFLLPGMIAISTGIWVFTIARRAKSSLLIRGQVPQISEFGRIGAIICVCLPFFFTLIFPGIVGGFLSILSSILLGWAAIWLAVDACRNISDN